MTASRRREGEALREALLAHCAQVESIANQLKARAPDLLAAVERKLVERLEQALGETMTKATTLSRDEVADRIRQEVTLYGLKMDVEEEIKRLTTHVNEVRRVAWARAARWGAARLPDAGTESRGEHGRLEGGRHRDDKCLGGTQDPHRADARTDPEPGVTVTDAHAVLAGNHAGSLFLVVAPSGAGKSTLVNALLARDPNIELSISYTTRPPRPGDRDGREYHFVTTRTSCSAAPRRVPRERGSARQLLRESRRRIEERVRAGIDVLLEIDWQGARQVTGAVPARGRSLHPAAVVRGARGAPAQARAGHAAPVIARRLLAAGSEMAHAPEFDYAVVNEDFETAVGQLAAIVTATRLRTARPGWPSSRWPNSVLILLKIAVGIIIGSVAVISEAIHSAVDLVAAVIALFAVRKASQAADERHPYGHGKFENISGTVEGVLIFFAAVWIIYSAVRKLMNPGELETPSWGVLVMLVSAIVNIVVSRRLFKVGRETDSVALQADGWHLRTDVYTSLGVMVGLLVIWVVGRIWPRAPTWPGSTRRWPSWWRS